MRVEFPCVFHVRCTEAMRDEIKQRGGADWLRSLVKANSRTPGDDDAMKDRLNYVPLVSRPIARDTKSSTPAVPSRRKSSKARGRAGNGRVSLDKRKRRRV